MRTTRLHWQVRATSHPLTEQLSTRCTTGYSDDEQGPKHPFVGQRVSDRPNAVNTSLNAVTLTTGHCISTLLGIET
jgi:hypothetical protein